MVDFRKLSDRAKDLVEKRGGTDGLKQDAEQLREIAKGKGSLSDKAKAAAAALKEPGGTAVPDAAAATPAATEAPAPKAEPTKAEEPARERLSDEARAERKAERREERAERKESGDGPA